MKIFTARERARLSELQSEAFVAVQRFMLVKEQVNRLVCDGRVEKNGRVYRVTSAFPDMQGNIELSGQRQDEERESGVIRIGLLREVVLL